MPTLLVQACDSADVDSATQVCAHPVWVVQQSFLPDLSLADGSALGLAVMLLFATAWAWRQLSPSRGSGE